MSAAVRAGDRAADGQSQADPDNGALLVAALELVEQPLGVPGRQARALVIQLYPQVRAVQLAR